MAAPALRLADRCPQRPRAACHGVALRRRAMRRLQRGARIKPVGDLAGLLIAAPFVPVPVPVPGRFEFGHGRRATILWDAYECVTQPSHRMSGPGTGTGTGTGGELPSYGMPVTAVLSCS